MKRNSIDFWNDILAAAMSRDIISVTLVYQRAEEGFYGEEIQQKLNHDSSCSRIEFFRD